MCGVRQLRRMGRRCRMRLASVEVNVEVQRCAEALGEGDRPGLGAGAAIFAWSRSRSIMIPACCVRSSERSTEQQEEVSSD